jgi:exodeoxyribonuclease VII large subunit
MSQAVARDGSRLGVAARRLTGPHEAFVARAASNLDALSPLRVLARGYAIARDADGRVISSAADLDVGESIDVRLGIGSVVACVTEVRPGHEGTGA